MYQRISLILLCLYLLNLHFEKTLALDSVQKIINQVCSPSTCQNGGYCIQSGSSAYCICPYGYTGDFCQTVVNRNNACNYVICQNGGTCTSNFNLAFCSCPRGFAGIYCQVALVPTPKPSNNLCLSNPCKNGGYCLAVSNLAYCFCVGGHTGTYCEK